MRSVLGVIACLSVETLLAFSSAKAAVPQSLTPARYLNKCNFYDQTPPGAIGQTFPSSLRKLSIIYNLAVVAVTLRPFTPRAYVLSTRDNRQYLYVSGDEPLFTLRGGSYTYLGTALSNEKIIKQIKPFLRSDDKKQHLQLTPCFSRSWDGIYPDGTKDSDGN